jgi:carbamoylphosphate synthase small subunit
VIDFADPNQRNLVAEASRTTPHTYAPANGGDIDILAVDCGMKENIIRQLVERGARVKVVPWNHDISQARVQTAEGAYLSSEFHILLAVARPPKRT